ncbi:hypothetical protein WG906_10970 [Pedobacter sp. P351]|uniref:hypothetical protein n=1 Tax=Pedobacter superstes TaxID=3133441 RepID=UPI0030AEC5C0
MKKIFIAIAVFTSLTAASAQTKPAQKKAEVKKAAKAKECTKEDDNCCSPGSKARVMSTAKKAVTKV